MVLGWLEELAGSRVEMVHIVGGGTQNELLNQFTANADLHREVDLGLAKATNVALGVEYRRETYQIIAGEPASYIDGGSLDQTGRSAGTPGAQVFPGFRPANEVDASRNSVALNPGG